MHYSLMGRNKASLYRQCICLGQPLSSNAAPAAMNGKCYIFAYFQKTYNEDIQSIMYSQKIKLFTSSEEDQKTDPFFRKK
jgi:hypothetical protein